MAVRIWTLAFIIMRCSGMGQYFSSMTIQPKDTAKMFSLDADSQSVCVMRCVKNIGCEALVYSDRQSSCTGYSNSYYSGVTLDGILEHGWIVKGEFQEKMHLTYLPA
jgi:hypothetical protein